MLKKVIKMLKIYNNYIIFMNSIITNFLIKMIIFVAKLYFLTIFIKKFTKITFF